MVSLMNKDYFWGFKNTFRLHLGESSKCLPPLSRMDWLNWSPVVVTGPLGLPSLSARYTEPKGMRSACSVGRTQPFSELQPIPSLLSLVTFLLSLRLLLMTCGFCLSRGKLQIWQVKDTLSWGLKTVDRSGGWGQNYRSSSKETARIKLWAEPAPPGCRPGCLGPPLSQPWQRRHCYKVGCEVKDHVSGAELPSSARLVSPARSWPGCLVVKETTVHEVPSLLLADGWLHTFASTRSSRLCVIKADTLSGSSVAVPVRSVDSNHTILGPGNWSVPRVWLSGPFGMTMVLHLLLQKPLSRGPTVKVFDRLPVLPTIHRHLEFLSFGKCLCICSLFSLAVYRAFPERLSPLLCC